MTLSKSVVDGNTAQGLVGGGIASGDYINFSGTSSFLTLDKSEVDNNTAPNAGGGGIQNLLGTVRIDKSEVDGNIALNGGGISSGPGNGGAPGPATSQLIVNKSEVDGNTAIAPVPQPGLEAGPPIAAGGIANGGNAVLNKTEVDHNTASFTSGAGIVNHGTMTLNKSEVNGNTAAGNSGVIASGGGIVSAQGPPGTVPTTLTLNNSVVKNNSAGGDGRHRQRHPPARPDAAARGSPDLEPQQGDRQHRSPRGRHLQQRRHGDPGRQLGHPQHPGQLRAPGHHHRLHRLNRFSPVAPLSRRSSKDAM